MVSINAELVYVPINQPAIHLRLVLAEGTTIAEAVHQSGVLQSHPEIESFPIGIFGALVSPTQVVKEGDRIEIYRSLMFDPKEKRRQRARQK